MIYKIHRGTNNHVIILLHGTGGDESDLMGLGIQVDSQATLVGIRGDVIQQGMNRYFLRNDDGSFDQENLQEKTAKLIKEIEIIVNKEDLSGKTFSLLGFSNGANVGISFLKTMDVPFKVMLLFHPNHGQPDNKFLAQSTASVFVSYGDNDPFVTHSRFTELVRQFKEANIDLEIFTHGSGHKITSEELQAAILFYRNNIE